MPQSPLSAVLALRALTEWWADAGMTEIGPGADPGAGKQATGQQATGQHARANLGNAGRDPVPSRDRIKDTPNPPHRAASNRDTPAAGETYVSRPQVDAIEEAQKAARGATDLAALAAALEAFDHCDLKKGARNLVFSDGVAGAHVMIVGEAPGREEDAVGRPFVGPSGQLLDRMFAAIGLSRQSNLYIANTLPWRPPGNRNPEPDEIAMCLPFLIRHIELAAPKVLILTGRVALTTLVPEEASLAPARGRILKVSVPGAPALPALAMYHPAYLLRRPIEKAKAWQDLLSLKSWLLANGLIPSHVPDPSGDRA